MGAEVFPANIATCPHCGNTFPHNKINGVSLIATVSDIDARKRMYCKLGLDSIERLAQERELKFTMIKKIFLDNFNDFNRDIQSILGYDDGVE